MQDFKNFSSNEKTAGFNDKKSKNNTDLISMITSIARSYDGKNEDELLRAIYIEAERNRKAGTLSDSDIDNFTTMLSPILDDKKRKKLYDIANKLKRKRL